MQLGGVPDHFDQRVRIRNRAAVLSCVAPDSASSFPSDVTRSTLTPEPPRAKRLPHFAPINDGLRTAIRASLAQRGTQLPLSFLLHCTARVLKKARGLPPGTAYHWYSSARKCPRVPNALAMPCVPLPTPRRLSGEQLVLVV